MFGLNPYALALKAAVVVAALLAGFTGGWKTESWRWGAAEAKQLEQAVAERQKVEERLAKVSADYEQAKAARNVETRTITKTVDRIVEKPVYRAVCLDDDGLRAANAALAPAADPGRPGGPVPGARPAR